jgi:DNA polymerase III sliding clamp (beta) subunit (PCNA family)
MKNLSDFESDENGQLEIFPLLEIPHTGDAGLFEISASATYLLNAIKKTTGDIVFGLNPSSILITGQSERSLHVVMPMRM